MCTVNLVMLVKFVKLLTPKSIILPEVLDSWTCHLILRILPSYTKHPRLNHAQTRTQKRIFGPKSILLLFCPTHQQHITEEAGQV